MPLRDGSMRLSKTHAAFDVDEAGLWVTDRASRNGTSVTEPGRASRELEPGTRTRVPVGARVTLGGRTFEVVAEGGEHR